MIKINNSRLAGYSLSSFNPSLVRFDGKLLLFYRFIKSCLDKYTNIAFVELNSEFQPISKHHPLCFPVREDVATTTTFDDPRAFVWKDQLWLMFIQGVEIVNNQGTYQKWSTAIVLSQIDLDGNVIQTLIPNYGNNINFAVADAPPALEKNWVLVVVADDLYLIYELNPLTVIKFQPENNTWIEVSSVYWKTHFQTYLSGSTPLIYWYDSQYIGLYHTYDYDPVFDVRTYSMGFYSVDVHDWRVTHISKEPILTGKSGIFKQQLRKFLINFQKKYDDKLVKIIEPLIYIPYKTLSDVVFPCGIINCGESWAVSFGGDDHNSYIEIYDQREIAKSLDIVTV